MPLSNPSDREHIHTRRVECRGFKRSDGLWDIEGCVVDTKSYDFKNHDRGEVRAGTPVHEMWIRVTVDDDYLIHDIEASTEHGPYRICPQAAPAMASLRGARIGPGWRREIAKHLGGTKGCTHLRELLGPIATTAFQTIAPIKARTRSDSKSGGKPSLIDTCFAYAADREVVARIWPNHAEASAVPDHGDTN